MFVSARYTNAEATQVAATDGEGRQWHHGVDCQLGDWLAYVSGGGTVGPFQAPPVDLAIYVARKRWEKEVGGISVGGLAVHTDDRSKMMIMGARLKAAADPDFATAWKIAGGAFVTLGAAALIAISDAVLAHVDACFAREAEVLAAIAAGTITTTAGIDAAFAA